MKNKSKVRYLNGAVLGPGNTSQATQHDAWKVDADCGCGIDCCNGHIALPVTNTVTNAMHDGRVKLFYNPSLPGVVLQVSVDLPTGTVVHQINIL